MKIKIRLNKKSQIFEIENEFKEKNLENLQKETTKMRNFAQEQLNLIVEEMSPKYAINSKGYQVKTTDNLSIPTKDYEKLLEIKRQGKINYFPWELSNKEIDDILNPKEPKKKKNKSQVSQNDKQKSKEEDENWKIDF